MKLEHQWDCLFLFLVDDHGRNPRVRQDAVRAVRVGVIVDNDELLPGADEGALRGALRDHNRVSAWPSHNAMRGEKGSPGSSLRTLPLASFSTNHP